MAKPTSGFYFKDWVEFYGRGRLAEDLKVEKCTCDKWAQGLGIPKVKHMRSIKKLSKGVVDYRHIIEGEKIQSPVI